MFGAAAFRSYTFRAKIFTGSAGVIPPPVIPNAPRREVWWPVTPNRRDRQRYEDESKEQGRTRAFAEMVDALEDISPEKIRAAQKQARALERKAAALLREQEADEQATHELLASLERMKAMRDSALLAAEQKIALAAAYHIEQLMARRRDEENAIAVLLMAELA